LSQFTVNYPDLLLENPEEAIQGKIDKFQGIIKGHKLAIRAIFQEIEKNKKLTKAMKFVRYQELDNKIAETQPQIQEVEEELENLNRFLPCLQKNPKTVFNDKIPHNFFKFAAMNKRFHKALQKFIELLVKDENCEKLLLAFQSTLEKFFPAFPNFPEKELINIYENLLQNVLDHGFNYLEKPIQLIFLPEEVRKNLARSKVKLGYPEILYFARIEREKLIQLQLILPGMQFLGNWILRFFKLAKNDGKFPVVPEVPLEPLLFLRENFGKFYELISEKGFHLRKESELLKFYRMLINFNHYLQKTVDQDILKALFEFHKFKSDYFHEIDSMNKWTDLVEETLSLVKLISHKEVSAEDYLQDLNDCLENYREFKKWQKRSDVRTSMVRPKAREIARKVGKMIRYVENSEKLKRLILQKDVSTAGSRSDSTRIEVFRKKK